MHSLTCAVMVCVLLCAVTIILRHISGSRYYSLPHAYSTLHILFYGLMSDSHPKDLFICFHDCQIIVRVCGWKWEISKQPSGVGTSGQPSYNPMNHFHLITDVILNSIIPCPNLWDKKYQKTEIAEMEIPKTEIPKINKITKITQYQPGCVLHRMRTFVY